MSTEVRKEIDIIPAQAVIKEVVRYVYACRRCENEALSTPIKRADAPEPVCIGYTKAELNNFFTVIL